MRTKTILASLGLVAALMGTTAVSLITAEPVPAEGYSLLGHNLTVAKRDFRVNNNFADAAANNNTTPHVDYPGHTGAVMAIWKGHAEWGSDPHGTGGGDPVGGNVIGSGNANLDFSFQGTTTSTGNFNHTHRVLAGSSGSTLAYMTGGSNWHIRYYEGWTWQDGPGSVGGTDLQGVACHEVGHALGLGHTNAGGSTMTPFSNGTADRSIATDDINGLQAIYGAEAGTKPHITSISGAFTPGSTLTINGSNFSDNNNKVWFTNTADTQTAAQVTGVSSTGGGTQVQVVIPANAAKGDVLVQRNQTGHSSLSNAWPLNVITASGDPPIITSLSQSSGPNAGYTEMNIFGVGFTGVHTVRFGDDDVITFTVEGPGNIACTTPPGTLNDVVAVTVIDDDGTSVLPSAYTYSFNQMIDVDSISPTSGPTTGGTLVMVEGPNCVPIFDCNFDGTPGTNIDILSASAFTVETPAHAAGTVDVEADGFGFSTLPSAFTYVETEGGFVDLGPGLVGVGGPPNFTGSGDLTPVTGGFTLSMTGAAPSTGGMWWISLSEGSNELLCGPLYPSIPFLVGVAVITDGNGDIIIPGVIPAGADGLSIVMQMYFGDTSGPCGVTSTNGLRVDIP